ncbi:hypothetical protein LZG04_15865 [Saccharothrix sp. S26]|uniref:hypothetical protein n=1 Tax=Saccharothrix sp. S26 TaxID=2907215 RepID=UPI001F1FBEB1|nr:hypothetical protein [Saccharothrix sp. S26]MCE6996262.1 hypothetical protein [Saccharothrix sp. S26]
MRFPVWLGALIMTSALAAGPTAASAEPIHGPGDAPGAERDDSCFAKLKDWAPLYRSWSDPEAGKWGYYEAEKRPPRTCLPKWTSYHEGRFEYDASTQRFTAVGRPWGQYEYFYTMRTFNNLVFNSRDVEWQ